MALTRLPLAQSFSTTCHIAAHFSSTPFTGVNYKPEQKVNASANKKRYALISLWIFFSLVSYRSIFFLFVPYSQLLYQLFDKSYAAGRSTYSISSATERACIHWIDTILHTGTLAWAALPFYFQPQFAIVVVSESKCTCSLCKQVCCNIEYSSNFRLYAPYTYTMLYILTENN